jgi:hypothetical protein
MEEKGKKIKGIKTLKLFFKREEKLLNYEIGDKIIVIRKILLVLSILIMSLLIVVVFAPSIKMM